MKKNGFVLVGILILLVGLMTIGVALTSAVLSSSIKVQNQYHKLEALAYAEAGLNKGLWEINKVPQDAAWISQASQASGKLETDLPGGEYRVWIKKCNPDTPDCSYIESTGYLPNAASSHSTRTVRVKIVSAQSSSNVAFNYGVQADKYGVFTNNNVKITGSVFSNGVIWNGNGTTITGKAESHNDNWLLSQILGGTVNGDAYANIITATVKNGSKHYTNPPYREMPIPDSQVEANITAIENEAKVTVFNGTQSLSGQANQLGPAKITGDLNIANNAKVQLNGSVWVEGNVNIGTGVTIYLKPSYGNSSGVIIADNRANRTSTSRGTIRIGQGVTIAGIDSGHIMTPSYTMFISTQTPSFFDSWSDWSDVYAIDFQNPNTTGGVFYAPYGIIRVRNNCQPRAIAGAGIYLDTNAQVNYDSGLANSSYASGPAGKWTITEWLLLN
jgi:Tfp pilus assembly protein PilX